MRAAIPLALSLWLVACVSPPDLARGWLDALRRADDFPVIEEPPAELPAPEGLRAKSGDFRSVRLEWDPLLAGNVGGYAVERAGASDGPFERIAVLSGRFSTIHVDDDAALGDGATAHYRVRAFAPSGHLAAAPSPVVAATTAPPPAPPADLRAFSLQPRMVPLSWRTSEDPSVAGYVVERGPSSQGPFEQIARLAGRDSTVHVDRGLGDLRVLYYRVAAFNAAGAVGPATGTVRAVTKPEPLPPLGLRVAEQQLGSNRLEWQASVEPDLAGYRVLRRREGSDATEQIASLEPGEHAAVDGAVQSGEKVSYTVVAFDRDGLESDPAAPLVIESEDYEASAEPHPDGVRLRWNPRSEEGWERARILRAGSFRSLDLGVVTGSEFVDRAAAPGARYRYTIVLERGDQRRAPPSEPVEVVVPKT